MAAEIAPSTYFDIRLGQPEAQPLKSSKFRRPNNLLTSIDTRISTFRFPGRGNGIVVPSPDGARKFAHILHFRCPNCANAIQAVRAQ